MRWPSTPLKRVTFAFSTLHTLDATETINRIISVFPPHHQKQIRLQLAAVLKGVISQRLVPVRWEAGCRPSRSWWPRNPSAAASRTRTRPRC
ncbi:MAG: hypothetical protein IPI84_15625 [Holophagaceae bacterium]|nr:hypothetical protein [Holophagaceae bacterium]